MMTRQTMVFPIRSVLTRIENIVVIPIWAASEFVYSDIVASICYMREINRINNGNRV